VVRSSRLVGPICAWTIYGVPVPGWPGGPVPTSGCCRKHMGHASITVIAHFYNDMYDDELDIVASALDVLEDRPSEWPECLARLLAPWILRETRNRSLRKIRIPL
jgi:hypothetical protein